MPLFARKQVVSEEVARPRFRRKPILKSPSFYMAEALVKELDGVKFSKQSLSTQRKKILQKQSNDSGSMNLGKVHRMFTKFIGPTKDTERFPTVWEAVKAYAAALNPDFKWTTVTINKNIKCLPHFDKKNYGQTMIVSLGDFTGGRLHLVETDEMIDIKGKPHYFNGSQVLHSTEDFTGSRYSLMFYNHGKSEGTTEMKDDEKTVEITVKDQTFSIRPATTDENVVTEIFTRNVYERKNINFMVGRYEKWLDLGANIGLFSLLALSRGATVVGAYEPEQENYELLLKNLDGKAPAFCQAVSATGEEDKLYLCRKPENKWRHCLRKTRGRKTVPIKSVPFRDALATVFGERRDLNCIKMDIEGAEIPLLEAMTVEDLTRFSITKMVFEYSFDVDRSIPRFMAIIHKLRRYFDVVHFDKVNPESDVYHYFPAATMVFCIKHIA